MFGMHFGSAIIVAAAVVAFCLNFSPERACGNVIVDGAMLDARISRSVSIASSDALRLEMTIPLVLSRRKQSV